MVATTQLSSKGQVVIPEDIRSKLGLKPGSRFVVVGRDGVVIFKMIEAPPLNEFRSLIAQARQQARKSGVRKSDVTAAVRRARGRRR